MPWPCSVIRCRARWSAVGAWNVASSRPPSASWPPATMPFPARATAAPARRRSRLGTMPGAAVASMRWHRTFRDRFLSELDPGRIQDLADLNARLWAWIESVYHRTAHAGLQGRTPLDRYQQDLPRIRTLGHRAARLDELFHHRLGRKVRKDGTVSYQGDRFEVPYELSAQRVVLVVDPCPPGRCTGSKTRRVKHSVRRRPWMRWPTSTENATSANLLSWPRAAHPPSSMPWSWPTANTTASVPRRSADVSATLRPETPPPLGKEATELWDDGALAPPRDEPPPLDTMVRMVAGLGGFLN